MYDVHPGGRTGMWAAAARSYEHRFIQSVKGGVGRPLPRRVPHLRRAAPRERRVQPRGLHHRVRAQEQRRFRRRGNLAHPRGVSAALGNHQQLAPAGAAGGTEGALLGGGRRNHLEGALQHLRRQPREEALAALFLQAAQRRPLPQRRQAEQRRAAPAERPGTSGVAPGGNQPRARRQPPALWRNQHRHLPARSNGGWLNRIVASGAFRNRGGRLAEQSVQGPSARRGGRVSGEEGGRYDALSHRQQGEEHVLFGGRGVEPSSVGNVAGALLRVRLRHGGKHDVAQSGQVSLRLQRPHRGSGLRDSGRNERGAAGARTRRVPVLPFECGKGNECVVCFLKLILNGAWTNTTMVRENKYNNIYQFYE